MYRSFLAIVLLLVLDTVGQAQSYLSYGLQFNGHEAVAEKRTAFEIAGEKPMCLSGTVRLEFDLNFISYNHIYFGYITRILNGNQNIDLIYDQRASLFRVISGQHFFNISFPVDAFRLYNEWNRLSINMDPHRQQISLSVNDKVIGSAPFAFSGNCFRFLYGANDDERFHTRDIPPMRVKDIRIFDEGKLHAHWPLEEVADTICYDVINHQSASVKNGVWLKPGHQYWKMVSSFKLNGNAVTAFDARNEQLLITGIDSVITYDLRHNQRPRTGSAAPQENILVGCQGIYDTVTGKLYNCYIDHKKVATYNASSLQWSTTFPDTILTEYWHANKFISPIDTSLYIIGGYGQLKYKNQVQRYHLSTGKWEMLTAGGNFFPPRYLAGLGLNGTGDTAFIMGGYGSITGDQMLDPRGYYDLFSFDVKRKTFSKRFNLDSVYGRFTFANSIVIDAKRRQYYGLVFPKDSFNSRLQLLQGSLDKPVYKLTASPFPYSFYDVQSFADLYYAPGVGKLVAVTLLYADQELKQRETEVKIYTIDFPPLDLDIAAAADISRQTSYKWLVFIGLFFVTAVIVLWGLLRKRQNRVRQYTIKQPGIEPSAVSQPAVPPETNYQDIARQYPGKQQGLPAADPPPIVAAADNDQPTQTDIPAGTSAEDQHTSIKSNLADSNAAFIPGAVLPEGEDVAAVQAPATAVAIPANTTTLPPASSIVPVAIEEATAENDLPRSGIRLFGPFQAFNEKGEDLTALFTPLMKELLLLILIYTIRTGQGITSDELNEILWTGKSAKDAKNNRSVNLAKLKSILERIGNCMVNKRTIYWQFQYTSEHFHLDYAHFASLTKKKGLISRTLMADLLHVLETGSFLAKTEYNWLDDIKAEVSNAVIDLSLNYLKHESDDPEFVIRVANAMFFFDRLNEEALEYKCKSLVQLRRYSLANNTYEKFAKDYKDIYGEEFYKQFSEVIRVG